MNAEDKCFNDICDTYRELKQPPPDRYWVKSDVMWCETYLKPPAVSAVKIKGKWERIFLKR